MLTEALRLALHDYAKAKNGAFQKDEKGKRVRNLRVIANQLVKRACAGDTTAIREVFDRLEGKPQQDVTVKGQIEQHIIQLIQGLDAVATDQDQADGKPDHVTEH